MATRKRKTVGTLKRPHTDIDDLRETVKHHHAKLTVARLALEAKLGRKLHWVNPGTGEVRQIDDVLSDHDGHARPAFRAPDVQVQIAKSIVRYDLIPWEALDEIADVFTRGAPKHGERGWETRRPSRDELVSKAMRHISASMRGEKFDPDTNLSHLAHAASDLMIAVELEE